MQSSDIVQLTPKQSNIYVWGWQEEARFRDVVAGRRFGKTFLSKAEMRRAARLAMKWGVSIEDEIWFCAPTFKQAKRVFWRRLKAAIPKSWLEKRPNESECSITLKTGHVIRVVGLADYDNLRGSGLFFCVIDEWASCPYIAWEEVLRPMLSTCRYTINGVQRHGGHVLRIGTPAGFNHCYDTWLLGQSGEDNHKSWLYTTLEGGNVPQSEIDAAKRSMDAKTFRQEYEASFENYQGTIYYCFNRIESHCEDVIAPNDDLHIGMDFNVQHMSAVVYVMRDGLPKAVDEIVDLYDTPAMIDEINKRYQGHKIFVYPDASGDSRKSTNASKTDISLLTKAGFIVRVNSKNPNVKDRINSMNAMLLNTYGDRRLKINTAKCPVFTKCLERQIWNEKGEPDKTQGHDHMNDAGTYFIAYQFPINSDKVNKFNLKGV